MIDIPNLVLASQSPRRKALLEQLGLKFSLHPSHIEELYSAELPKQEVPVYLAKLKAADVRGRVGTEAVIIASDTIVLKDGVIYEKPLDRDDALRMLSELSGGVHEVITGVCVSSSNTEITFSDTTKVTFKHLTAEEITWYVDNFEVLDKAGAYAIQEGIGLIGVERIEGSYFNVVGLPVQKLYEVLKALT